MLTSSLKVPMMLNRQRLLLKLLRAIGGRAEKVDFQNLLHLYCSQAGGEPPYEFVPGKLGAYSFTCCADRRKLVDRGLIENSSTIWKLTPKGRKVQGTASEDIVLFAHQMKGLRGGALAARSFRSFPYYAIRSEIAAKVLQGDSAALDRIEEARPVPGWGGLFTLGYEGRSLEGFLNILILSSITVLCDVRRNPFSRKFGFSKKTLAHACEQLGIQYEHLPGLGIPSEERNTLQTQAEYDVLFKTYARDSLPHQKEAISRIAEWIRSGSNLALTCYERDPLRCHRHCVAEAVEGVLGSPVHHL